MEGGIAISTYELPWFKWNGVDAKTYGVQILTLPPIETTPLERTNEVSIPGRSGSLTITEGDDIYDKISLSCSCIIEDTSKISAFCGWMKGTGKAKFSNRSDGYYKGRVANQISFDKVLRGYDLRTFSIQLSCRNCTAKKPSPTRELLILGRLDSNQRMRESKSRALPLGDAPMTPPAGPNKNEKMG